MTKNVFTVKQVNAYIKSMLARDSMLSRLYVKGEVSNLKYHHSGHIYFSLKDESGTIACVMFAGARSGLSFRMREGQQVIVLGYVGVYERGGSYQLYAREIVPDGEGRLYERYEALKKELAEMGMFAAEYKQPIPPYIRTLGVVTAPTGAAVRDIIQISMRRNPHLQIILCPAIVQGENAADSIVRGIRMLEQRGVDVMIVGRGGGSIEDLWAFNEEKVARAVFDCSVPIISAVGHETDTTIIDYVADLRAPTPSAAAELAVFDYRETKEQILAAQAALRTAMNRLLQGYEQQAQNAALRLKALHPRQQLADRRQYAADLENRLRALMQNGLTADRHRLILSEQRMRGLHPRGKIKDERQRSADAEERLRRDMAAALAVQKNNLALAAQRMKGLSPLERLSKGYAYVQTAGGVPLESVRAVQAGDDLQIRLRDGRVRAEVREVNVLHPLNPAEQEPACGI